MKPTVIALVGPTGSGKTRTAILLSRALNAEIVSMDSMQVYRGMDIGTAKPTLQERSEVPHHMIDVADPNSLYTVAMYREQAAVAVDDILNRGKLPILVGGTGLYLQAMSYDMNLGEMGADNQLREELQRIAAQPDGPQRLHNRLREIDPASADKLHPNDIRRVIRAIEIFEMSGKTKEEKAEGERKEGPYRILVYGLSLPREQMYARINERVDEMVCQGLIQEVQSLLDQGIEPRKEGGAMQAIGYKEIVGALRGEMSMERAVELIKQGSRRYAKRQWTWFRHDKRTKWFDWTKYATEEALLIALTEQIKRDMVS